VCVFFSFLYSPFNLSTSFFSSLFSPSFPYSPLFVLPLWLILRFHLEGLRFVGCSTGIGLFCNTPSPRKGPRFAREAHAPASCQPQSPLRLTIRASMSCVYMCVVFFFPFSCVLLYMCVRVLLRLYVSNTHVSAFGRVCVCVRRCVCVVRVA